MPDKLVVARIDYGSRVRCLAFKHGLVEPHSDGSHRQGDDSLIGRVRRHNDRHQHGIDDIDLIGLRNEQAALLGRHHSLRTGAALRHGHTLHGHEIDHHEIRRRDTVHA